MVSHIFWIIAVAGNFKDGKKQGKAERMENKLFREYLYNDREHQQKIIATLKEYLGDVFFMELVDFFKSMMKMDKVKIYMARRCFAMYQVFKKIIEYLYEDYLQETGISVTNLAVPNLSEELIRGREFVIVDDVMLHGRTVADVSDELLNMNLVKTENTPVHVFIRNIDRSLCKKYKNNTELLHVNHSTRDGDWRWMSSKMIDIFRLAGQPYVSYLPYIALDSKSEVAEAILSLVSDNDMIADKKEEALGVKTYILNHGKEPFSDDATRISEVSLVRVYHIESIDKIVVIPYAVIKALDTDIIHELFNYIKRNSIISGLNFDLGQGNNTFECKCQYIYALLTYVASKVIGYEFFKGLGYVDIPWSNETETMSFQLKVSDDVDELYKVLKKVVCIRDTEIQDAEPEYVEKESDRKDEDKINETLNIFASEPDRWYLDRYLMCSGEIDEKRARDQKSRLKGKQIYSLTKNREKDIWKNIIDEIDSGKGAIHVTYFSLKGGIIGSTLVAGEQQFACGNDLYICLALPVLAYEASCKLDGREHCTLQEKKSLVNKIMKEIPVIRVVLSNEKEKQIYRKDFFDRFNQYYLNEKVIYEQDENLRKAMELLND